MSNVERFMHGPEPRNIIIVPKYSSSHVFEVGDFVLVYRGGAITPACLGTIYSSATVARREARMIFAGICCVASAAGDTADIRVDISIEARFKLSQAAENALSIGDLLGIKATGSGVAWGLEDQQVEADCSYPIAVVTKACPSTSADVMAKLLPGKLFNVAHSYTICDSDSDLSYAG